MEFNLFNQFNRLCLFQLVQFAFGLVQWSSINIIPLKKLKFIIMFHNNNSIFIDYEICSIPKEIQQLDIKVNSNSIIKFPNSRGSQYLSLDNILYLKSDSNYTFVYFTNGKSQLFSKTLKHLTSFLPKEQFIRIHQSYVVNKRYISSITKLFLTLDNKLNLPISRRLKKTIKFYL